MPKKPTEMSPLERTQHVLDISATERNVFKTCRRQWELTVLENLEPAIPPTLDMEFGTGLHRALEGYYIQVSNLPALPDNEETYALPLKSALYEFDRWYEETESYFESSKLLDPITTDTTLQTLYELADLGEQMLKGYDKYAEPLDDFTVHAVEGLQTGAGKSWLKKHMKEREFAPEISENRVNYHQASRRFLCPIIHPSKKTRLKGNPVLSCRLDLLVHRIDPGMKGLWVIDHKSTASKPNDRGLDFDDQVTAYCYVIWRWLGIIPRGVCFNYLIKVEPKKPRILKSGKLSTAKDQLTTVDQYRDELVKQGLMLKSGKITSLEHEETYQALLSHGWDRFFHRDYITKSEHELLEFEARLYDEYQDMRDAFTGALAIYPNMDRIRCVRCQVNSICQAMEDGSDYIGVIESRYWPKPDRKAVMSDA